MSGSRLEAGYCQFVVNVYISLSWLINPAIASFPVALRVKSHPKYHFQGFLILKDGQSGYQYKCWY